MIMPPASGTCWRFCGSRVSAAASTAGIHSPVGSSAVRQARAFCSAFRGSPRRAACSSPALSRQRASPGVGQEDDGADHAVGKRFGVAVGVVGLRAFEAVALGS